MITLLVETNNPMLYVNHLVKWIINYSAKNINYRVRLMHKATNFSFILSPSNAFCWTEPLSTKTSFFFTIITIFQSRSRQTNENIHSLFYCVENRNLLQVHHIKLRKWRPKVKIRNERVTEEEEDEVGCAQYFIIIHMAFLFYHFILGRYNNIDYKVNNEDGSWKNS